MSDQNLMAAVKKQTIEVNSFTEVDVTGLRCPIIAIYVRPEDYPEDCVARLWDMEELTNILLKRGTVEEIRQDINKAYPWMVRFERAKNDVLSISETWI